MLNLIAASAYFVLIHLLVSGTRVRDRLIACIGLGPYTGLFVVLSVVGLVWLALAFGQARGSPDNEPYWSVGPASRNIQMLIQLLAVTLIVIGLSTRNPTSVRQEGVIERPDAVQGILRVTRHPFLWGVALWALGHLVVNGDRASFILFGSLLILAVSGTASIDAKRKRSLGPAWDNFAAQTSNVPFAAIVEGRQRLIWSEIGAWRILAAVAIYLALVLGHPHFTGVPALAG